MRNGEQRKFTNLKKTYLLPKLPGNPVVTAAAPAVVAGQAPKTLREETLLGLEEPWSYELGKSPHSLFLFLSCPVWYLRQRLPAYSTVGKYVSVISAIQFSSVQFSHSVVSDSLRPHESQHARPPCPSPTPGVHSDSCPSSP